MEGIEEEEVDVEGAGGAPASPTVSGLTIAIPRRCVVVSFHRQFGVLQTL